MAQERTVVVSGIGKRNALLELLAAECRGYGARVVGCDAVEWPPARIAVSHFSTVPSAREPTFRQAYADMLKREAASAYLTLIDPEIVPLGEMYAQGCAGDAWFAQPLCPTSQVCEDKYRFFEVMHANAIATVPTFLVPPDDAPFIRKDRKGSAGSGFWVYDGHLDELAAEAEVQTGRYVYQPFCAGRHYCIDAYFSMNDAKLVDLCAKEVLVKSNGESYLLEAVDRDRFVGVVEDVAAVLPMRGIVNFDIYDEHDRLKVMEVNCRIGGNYPASHAFGCNLLSLLVAEVFGGSLPSPARADYAVGRRVAKYFAFSPAFEASA